MKLRRFALACAAMMVLGYAIYSTLMVLNGNQSISTILEPISPALTVWRLFLYAALVCFYVYVRKRKKESTEDHAARAKALDKAVLLGAAVCVVVEISLAA